MNANKIPPSKIQRQVLQLAYQTPNNTNGPSYASSSGAKFPVPINTVVRNSIPGASLASDIITLPPGTYEVTFRVPFITSSENNFSYKAYLDNITDTIELVRGTSVFHGDYLTLYSVAERKEFTLSAQKTLQLTAVSTAAGFFGFAAVSAFGDGNDLAQVLIEKTG